MTKKHKPMTTTLSFSSFGREKTRTVTIDLRSDTQHVQILFDVEIQSPDPQDIDTEVREATWRILQELSEVDPDKLPLRKPLHQHL
jgi:hypothetical protein